LGQEVAATIEIPVIGIGAGVGCDGQVLVMHDMLGLGGRVPKFVANFMLESESVNGAFEAYVRAVKEGRFPTDSHSY
jgi:3-methyl-2-oxobutanoate hydroxymethyltransferase